MEKNLTGQRRLKRVLVTGPESTGKTELAGELAGWFGGLVIPEYARGYIERLGRPYTYEDVEHIAEQQAREYEREYPGWEWLFYDTWLILTRVWFQVVFNRQPDWLDGCIAGAKFDLVLLCAPDIPWIPDPVRENGGTRREELFERYKQELERFAMGWEIVTGKGDERPRRARQIIQRRIDDGTI
jgi:nicotinamide riboside kinase